MTIINAKNLKVFKVGRKRILFSILMFLIFGTCFLSSCFISTASYNYSLDRIAYDMCNYNVSRYPAAKDDGALLQVYPNWESNNHSTLDENHKKLCLSLQNSSMTNGVITVCDSVSGTFYESGKDDFYSFQTPPLMLSFYDYSGYKEQREPKAYKTNGVNYYTFFTPKIYFKSSEYYDFCIISEAMAKELCDNNFVSSFDDLLDKTITIYVGSTKQHLIINNIGFDSLREKGYEFDDLNARLVATYGKYYYLTYATSNNSASHEELEYHIDILTNYSNFSVYNCLESIKSTFLDSASYIFFAKRGNDYIKNDEAVQRFSFALKKNVNNLINLLSLPLIIGSSFLFVLFMYKQLLSKFYFFLFVGLLLLIVSLISMFVYFYYMWSILGIGYLLFFIVIAVLWRFKNERAFE